ncbi:MAG TPA: universal stress protein [Myxococcaceae bacterium]|nr:universal stress protein [Myxococcaceae bacterium]
MPIRRIIVAYDGSPPARRALAFAEELAQAFRSALTLLHAIHVPVTPPEAALAGWAELLAAEQRAGEALVDEAVQAVRKAGFQVEARVVVGSPAEQLAEAAAGADVDLVVAGTTGKGAMARVLLGSVTTRLLHISPKPVLVVP